MCGRYSFAQDLIRLDELIDFVCRVPAFMPRYNIAPRQQVPVIVRDGYLTVAKLMRWGLIPSFAKDENIGDEHIYAWAETLAEKSSFQKPFASQRCLVPADGYYEWQTTPHGKTPFRFTMKDGGLMCFAGLWERWVRPPQARERLMGRPGNLLQPGHIIETFTIITTRSNAMVAEIHDRMPVILQPEHYGWWLYEEGKDEHLKGLLHPYPAEDMKCYRVSDLINDVTNDGPECFRPG